MRTSQTQAARGLAPPHLPSGECWTQVWPALAETFKNSCGSFVSPPLCLPPPGPGALPDAGVQSRTGHALSLSRKEGGCLRHSLIFLLNWQHSSKSRSLSSAPPVVLLIEYEGGFSFPSKTCGVGGFHGRDLCPSDWPGGAAHQAGSICIIQQIFPKLLL